VTKTKNGKHNYVVGPFPIPLFPIICIAMDIESRLTPEAERSRCGQLLEKQILVTKLPIFDKSIAIIIITVIVKIRRGLLSMGQTVCLNIVRVGIFAHSDFLVSVTCDHMTVARRQCLI
jgi:hypothetical protein